MSRILLASIIMSCLSVFLTGVQFIYVRRIRRAYRLARPRSVAGSLADRSET